jgi:hypothetical protein
LSDPRLFNLFFAKAHDMKTFAISTPVLLASAQVLAHDGHGLLGSHWHSTDTLGFIVVGAIFAATLWFSREGK